MACNLAVSIAKAAVSNEQLRALLTPQIVQQVVLAYLQQQYPRENPRVRSSWNERIRFDLNSCTIAIKNGVIEVQENQGDPRWAQQLAQELEQLLTALAGQLFQQQVQQVLQQALGSALTDVALQEVEYEGRTQQAASFTLKL